ncbi:MAG: DNA repair protein RecO [Candidatus Ornithospirochaeta sp.]
MERDFKTLGIVVGKTNVRDNDVMLSILTPDHGVMDVFVYGVRKSSRAVRARLFTEANFSLSRKGENGKVYMRDLDVLSLHEGMDADLEKLGWGSLFSEMVVKARCTGGEVYSLFVETIDNMEEGDSDKCAIYFLVHFLRLQGLSGDWHSCPKCQKEYADDEILGFSPRTGCAVCSRCDEMEGTLILPPNARKYLARIYGSTFPQALALVISGEMVRRISRNLMRSLRYSFPGVLKTLDSGLIV